MILVSKGAVQEIADALISALLSAADHHGRPRVHKTIDPEILNRVALGALTATAGESVMIAGAEMLEKGPEEVLPFIKTVYPRG